jgi:MFS family permease
VSTGALDSGTQGSWRTVAMLALSETVAWGVLYYAFGVLMRPFAWQLAVPEAAVAGALSLALVCAGAAAWVGGGILDRRGPRRVMTLSAAVATLAFAALAAVDSLPAFYAAWALIGLTYAGVLYEPAFVAIARWFSSPRERARAFLTVTTVAGLASTIFLPLTAMLHERLGLQPTLLVLAALVGAIVVPLDAALPRHHATTPPRPGRVTSESPSPRLGVLAVVFSMQALASTGVSVHLVSHLREQGLDLGRAAWVAGLMGAAQVPARLLFQRFRRRVHARARLPLLFGLQAGAIVGLLGGGEPVVTAAVLLIGGANGLVTLERASLIADAFGPERYGAASGRVAACVHVARAAAPMAVGALAAVASHGLAFFVLALLCTLAAVLTARVYCALPSSRASALGAALSSRR